MRFEAELLRLMEELLTRIGVGLLPGPVQFYWKRRKAGRGLGRAARLESARTQQYGMKYGRGGRGQIVSVRSWLRIYIQI